MSRPPEPPADDQTRIIRRVPAQPDPQPHPDDSTVAGPRARGTTPLAEPDESRTGIIRRAPTGPIPVPDTSAGSEPATENLGAPTTQIRRPTAAVEPCGRPTTAVAACVLAMLSGWATTVVATNLIAGWWRTDWLFCAAVAFLTVVFAAATVSGVVQLLLRRPVGRYLIVAGAVVALLAFGGVFIAGARVPWIVYAMPVLPVATAVLAMLPSTRRWCTG